MAEDVIVLLDYIGWTEERGIYVVGLSMGGMIALGMLLGRLPAFTRSECVCQNSPLGYRNG
jgi:pimeloyl-ACP methyl ester carboxylesterase